MIEKQFWLDVKMAWIVSAPSKITNTQNEPSEELDFDLWNDFLDEEVPFDAIDFDKSAQAMVNGGEHVLKGVQGIQNIQHVPEVQDVQSKPKLDIEKFEHAMEQNTLQDYTEAAKLLLACELPEEMAGYYQELITRMPILQDAMIKFESVYQVELAEFYEYYIPETLQLTATYLEYLDVGISEDIIKETEEEIIDAVKKLIIAVNDKIDEIYKFASIEIKAKAKALESLMSLDGYIDPDFKLS